MVAAVINQIQRIAVAAPCHAGMSRVSRLSRLLVTPVTLVTRVTRIVLLRKPILEFHTGLPWVSDCTIVYMRWFTFYGYYTNVVDSYGTDPCVIANHACTIYKVELKTREH